MTKSIFQRLFNVEIPVIQAPMAGGITMPELVAAVSNTGALGSLGAGYMPPDEIRECIRKIKSLTSKPFNVNLFIPEESTLKGFSANKFLLSCWHQLTDTPFESGTPVSFQDQVEVLFEERVPIFSFTFGIPSASLIQKFKTQGTLMYGTATTPEEAELLEKAGVDAICCQGVEAGGHRGTFSTYDPLLGLFPLLSLTKQKVKIPLIAAGGIMDGSSVTAAFLVGAAAVQLGTAFLTAKESHAHPTYKKALLEKPHPPTALTKVFTGKPARGLVNTFMNQFDTTEILPYPAQHYLTQKLRSLAAQKKRPDLMSLWAGQGYPLCRSLSAAELVHQIVKEFRL